MAKYSWDLSHLIEERLNKKDLADCVIAYRRLGKANYDFAADVRERVVSMMPCVALCFDIEKFFDKIDHSRLKDKLKNILSVQELQQDWYVVFRQVTAYRFVQRGALLANVNTKDRVFSIDKNPICTIRDLMKYDIKIEKHADKFGIPQGTPISSTFSNLYLLDFDEQINKFCRQVGGIYRRYSDDILLVIPLEAMNAAEYAVLEAIKLEKLNIQPAKTDIVWIDKSSIEKFQYLGFHLSHQEAVIRSSSLSKQWRKARSQLKKIRYTGEIAVFEGISTKIYTKKLIRRFQPVGVKNFSRYARLAARSLHSQAILRQTRRLERFMQREIAALNDKPVPPADDTTK